MPELPVKSIPLSVVRLTLPQPTLEQVKGLLATRHTRDLQNVRFALVADSEVAALAAELVCTDPHTQWSYSGSFSGSAGSAFRLAAISAHSASHSSSLTSLDVHSSPDPEWSRLLVTHSTLRSFRVRFSNVTSHLEPV